MWMFNIAASTLKPQAVLAAHLLLHCVLAMTSDNNEVAFLGNNFPVEISLASNLLKKQHKKLIITLNEEIVFEKLKSMVAAAKRF